MLLFRFLLFLGVGGGEREEDPPSAASQLGDASTVRMTTPARILAIIQDSGMVSSAIDSVPALFVFNGSLGWKPVRVPEVKTQSCCDISVAAESQPGRTPCTF